MISLYFISQVIDKVINILVILIIIRFVLTTFFPKLKSNQLSMFLDDVTDPLLKPFQRLQLGSKAMPVDFSWMFAIIALNVIGWVSKILLSLFY
ncbi:MAG TPA: YggT family protein [Desulfosporosinus sp.]|nr:YggT family protein [Desulfosporosinus sp.]